MGLFKPAWQSQNERRALEAIGRWYRFVGVEEVCDYFEGRQRFNDCCLVTFDDGERSFLQICLRLYRRFRH